MMAKKAIPRSGGRAAAAKAPRGHETAPPPRHREKAEDFSDVMRTLDRVKAKNDELADRIDRLVTSLG